MKCISWSHQTWGYHCMIENDWGSLEHGLIEAQSFELGLKNGANGRPMILVILSIKLSTILGISWESHWYIIGILTGLYPLGLSSFDGKSPFFAARPRILRSAPDLRPKCRRPRSWMGCGGPQLWGYPNGWMVLVRENPNLKRMMTGGTPATWKPPYPFLGHSRLQVLYVDFYAASLDLKEDLVVSPGSPNVSPFKWLC